MSNALLSSEINSPMNRVNASGCFSRPKSSQGGSSIFTKLDTKSLLEGQDRTIPQGARASPRIFQSRQELCQSQTLRQSYGITQQGKSLVELMRVPSYSPVRVRSVEKYENEEKSFRKDEDLISFLNPNEQHKVEKEEALQEESFQRNEKDLTSQQLSPKVSVSSEKIKLVEMHIAVPINNSSSKIKEEVITLYKGDDPWSLSQQFAQLHSLSQESCRQIFDTLSQSISNLPLKLKGVNEEIESILAEDFDENPFQSLINREAEYEGQFPDSTFFSQQRGTRQVTKLQQEKIGERLFNHHKQQLKKREYANILLIRSMMNLLLKDLREIVLKERGKRKNKSCVQDDLRQIRLQKKLLQYASLKAIPDDYICFIQRKKCKSFMESILRSTIRTRRRQRCKRSKSRSWLRSQNPAHFIRKLQNKIINKEILNNLSMNFTRASKNAVEASDWKTSNKVGLKEFSQFLDVRISQECTFIPVTNQNDKIKNVVQGSFLERNANYLERTKKKKEKIQQFAECYDLTTGKRLFEPEATRLTPLLQLQGSKVSKELLSKSITNKKQSEKILTENHTSCPQKIINNRVFVKKYNCSPVAELDLERNEDPLRRKARAIFSLLDSDGDGKICDQFISVEGIEESSLDIIIPILQAIDESQSKWNFEDFFRSFEVVTNADIQVQSNSSSVVMEQSSSLDKSNSLDARQEETTMFTNPSHESITPSKKRLFDHTKSSQNSMFQRIRIEGANKDQIADNLLPFVQPFDR